jgi:hypothetical protein
MGDCWNHPFTYWCFSDDDNPSNPPVMDRASIPRN